MKFRVTPNSPLIVDRWLDVAFAALWGSYALWGLATLGSGLPTLSMAAPDWYVTLWAGAVGLFASVACLTIVSLFFESRISFIFKKKIERSAVIALSMLVFAYPILLWASVVGGDGDRVSIAALSLSYLIFPIYRVYVLNQRIKAYKSAVSAANNNERGGR